MTSIAIGVLALGGDHKKLLEIIPDHVKKTWTEWALQVLVFISIASQVVLFLLGNLRKHNPRTRIRISLWCAYLVTYAVASGALSIITRSALDVCSTSHPVSISEKPNTSELMSFWAPFFLLHLGGPDTITAYSLEDNELWLRHLAEVGFQSGVAIYILLLSWPGCSNLPLLSVLVYIAGFIKCFERIRALLLANTEYLRDSMLGSPDPGPNYPKFLENYHLRKSQGYNVSVGEVPEAQFPVNDNTYPKFQGDVISEAYYLFQAFKRIFVDLILTFEDRDKSQFYFSQLKSKEAFNLVEIELGFAYDMLYTKANVLYTFVGLVLRVTSVFILLMSLVGFCFLCDVHDYRITDVAITYLLFATSVVMEIVAVITMLRSDRTDVWLSQRNYSRNILIFPFLKQPTKLRWSGCIAQLDLLSVALEEKPASLLTTQKLLGIEKYRVKHRYKTYSKVSSNLKNLIYNQFQEFMRCSSDPKALCNHKGSFSLRKNACDDQLWSINKVDFDQSIILWHIATTLCFYSEELDNQGDIDVYRLESKHISDYMLYLLVSYPVMLPIGIGMIRYRDTCAEATRYFKEKGPITEKVKACKKLLKVCSLDVLPSKVKGDRCKSALFDGCRLELTLKKMETERMWKVMSQLWIEILAYAATHCRGFQHEQQLRKGGEFLTHVWLLMAHLGITEQFQVSQGHARAKLVVA
ncbi:hypothetical protein HanRHA438_Chr14g0633491 [Helianthus annuus]|nr:hypothetical protein HanHA89_Chr14g0542361 [Helianthus annuus]KAJ0658578.1 hypothetical protein HanOQP8_Chr14g0509811 [Helianthus annuus]KAJ0852026.1 hypothetical protein HanRHA438_Chr14g0633491 [Helianthus annuus]